METQRHSRSRTGRGEGVELGGTGIALRIISHSALWWHFPCCNATPICLFNYLSLPLGFEFLESSDCAWLP